MRHNLLGGAMVIGAAILWGTLGLFARSLGAIGLTPLELASIRAACAAIGLGPWLILRRPDHLRIRSRDLVFFLAYGFIGVALFYYLYFATLERTSIAVAVALLYTAPAFVVIAARLLDQEPIDAHRATALGLVLAGVFLVTGALRLIATGQATITIAAILLGLGSGISYGLYTIFGKCAVGRYAPYQTVFYTFLFGSLILSLLAPPWAPFQKYPHATIPLLLLGVAATIVPYLLYINALRHLPSGTASMLASIEPVVATLLGFIFLGEAMTLDQGAGVAAIVLAAFLLARGSTRTTTGTRAGRSTRTTQHRPTGI